MSKQYYLKNHTGQYLRRRDYGYGVDFHSNTENVKITIGIARGIYNKDLPQGNIIEGSISLHYNMISNENKDIYHTISITYSKHYNMFTIGEGYSLFKILKESNNTITIRPQYYTSILYGNIQLKEIEGISFELEEAYE